MMRIRNRVHTIEMPIWLSEDSEADEESLAVEFNFTPEERPQYYESHGRAPDPGCPAEVEVVKLTRENGTVLDWDELDHGIQQYTEEQCFEHINMLAEAREDFR